MTEQKPRRARHARHDEAEEETATAEQPVRFHAGPTPTVCNTDGCSRAAEVRGLCPAHWAARRGDATDKEIKR